MDQGSVDPLFGPGPQTTIMGRVHGPPVMDRVHGHFVNFYRKFLHLVHEHSFLNSESWKKQNKTENNKKQKKQDLKRRCRPSLTADHKYLVVLTGRTLCLHMCSRKTVKLIQKFSLQYKDSQQAAVKHSLLLEQLWLSHIAILHSWCSFRLSCNPCHFFFFFFEIWICKSLGFQQFENRPLKKVQSRFDPRILFQLSVSRRVWDAKLFFLF